MIIKNAQAGLMLKRVIVTDLLVNNQVAEALVAFDENSQTLDMDYEIRKLDSSPETLNSEVKLKTKIVIKVEKQKRFELQVTHLGLVSAPTSAFDTEEDFDKAVELNGLASLISFARANIASISGLTFCHGNIVLPMINVYKLNDLKRAKEKSKE